MENGQGVSCLYKEGAGVEEEVGLLEMVRGTKGRDQTRGWRAR